MLRPGRTNPGRETTGDRRAHLRHQKTDFPESRSDSASCSMRIRNEPCPRPRLATRRPRSIPHSTSPEPASTSYRGARKRSNAARGEEHDERDVIGLGVLAQDAEGDTTQKSPICVCDLSHESGLDQVLRALGCDCQLGLVDGCDRPARHRPLPPARDQLDSHDCPNTRSSGSCDPRWHRRQANVKNSLLTTSTCARHGRRRHHPPNRPALECRGRQQRVTDVSVRTQ